MSVKILLSPQPYMLVKINDIFAQNYLPAMTNYHNVMSHSIELTF